MPQPQPDTHQLPSLSSFIISTTNTTTTPSHHNPTDLPPSVLYFFHPNNHSLSPEKRNRLLGLAQGILNFSSVLAHGLHPNPSTQNVRVIHSANQNMVYLHPEPGFHFCAVIKLPKQPAQPPTNSLNLLSPQPPPSHSSYQPSETVLLNSLSWAAQEYRLLNGSLTSVYNTDRQILVDRLQKFWSVWLWRWNVGKTGCGAIDLDEFFGHLESPLLQPPQLLKHSLDSFNRFVNHICPAFSVLPILIHNQNILHLPPPTESIKQQEIQTLARYLSSLLGGSEAKPATKHRRASTSVLNKDQQEHPKQSNIFTDNLSGFNLNTILNLRPKFRSISQTHEPNHSWAQKALAWASIPLAVPKNFFDPVPSDIETLDQQLRADLGLMAKASPKVVSVKSVPSNPQLFTHSPPPITSRASGHHDSQQLDHFGDQFLRLISFNNDTKYHKIGYPENLLSIYPPKKTRPRSLHYPHNLMNLYGETQEDCREHEDSINQPAVSSSVREQLREEQTSRTMLETAFKPSASASSADSKHNPRSSDFNVEDALADAMSEYSIGNIAYLEPTPSNKNLPTQVLPPIINSPTLDDTSPGPIPSRSASVNDRPSRPGSSNSPVSILSSSSSINHTSTVKQIKIFVNEGELETNVIWIQYEDWSLALLVARFGDDTQGGKKALDEQDPYGTLIEQARLVLKALVRNERASADGSNPEPGPGSSGAKMTKPPAALSQRYVVRSLRTGMFFKHSTEHSAWLTKSQIWPGKIVPQPEVEVTHAVLTFLAARDGACSAAQADRARRVGAQPGDSTIWTPIDEGFIRTSAGQWVVFKHILRHPPAHGLPAALDILLVLPPGFGTLIEADNELRILERRCEDIKLSIL